MHDNGTNNLFNDQNIELERLWWVLKDPGGAPIMEMTWIYGSKDPLFSALLSPNDPIFLLIVSAITQRPHIFYEMWAFPSLSPKDPPMRQIIFAIFDVFFFCKFLLLKCSLIDQK